MRIIWAIGLVMAGGLPGQPPDCGVAVYVTTKAAMPSATFVSAATSRAIFMFREINVRVRMTDGSPGVSNGGDSCRAPIVIQIEDSRHYAGLTNTLAYAMPYQDGGTAIHVFLDALWPRMATRLSSSRY
jgi:hypothetical protein